MVLPPSDRLVKNVNLGANSSRMLLTCKEENVERPQHKLKKGCNYHQTFSILEDGWHRNRLTANLAQGSNPFFFPVYWLLAGPTKWFPKWSELGLTGIIPEKNGRWPRQLASLQETSIRSGFLFPTSVSDPWHFETETDPWINTMENGSGSCSFCQWLSRNQQKISFFPANFLF
jgi:hypothetical protein